MDNKIRVLSLITPDIIGINQIVGTVGAEYSFSTFESIEFALRALDGSNFDIFLLDLDYFSSKEESIEYSDFVLALRHTYPEIGIIVLSHLRDATVDFSKQILNQFITAGVSYIAKEDLSNGEELFTLFRLVSKGNVILTYGISAFIEKLSVNGDILTSLDTKIIELLNTSKTNHQIAEQLNLSDNIVDLLIRALINKVGVNKRTELTEWHQRLNGDPTTSAPPPKPKKKRQGK